MNNKTQNEKYVSHSYVKASLPLSHSFSQSTPFISPTSHIKKYTRRKNSVCPKQKWARDWMWRCDYAQCAKCSRSKKKDGNEKGNIQFMVVRWISTTNCQSHGWSQDDWTFTMSLFCCHLVFIYLFQWCRIERMTCSDLKHESFSTSTSSDALNMLWTRFTQRESEKEIHRICANDKHSRMKHCYHWIYLFADMPWR